MGVQYLKIGIFNQVFKLNYTHQTIIFAFFKGIYEAIY